MLPRFAPLVTTAALSALTVLVCVACGREHGDARSARSGEGATLSVKGSDTMVILSQRWAEAFMEDHPSTLVQVSGGGSGAGISALLAGTADIASASRPMSERERAALRHERHVEAHETQVALDAVAVYVHADNAIPWLTMDQLADIYRGRITRWDEVGGADRAIILYSRENNSGTYAFFKERVLGGADFALTTETLPGTAAVIHAVTADLGGIGYGGIGYARGTRTVPIVDAGGTAIEPTLENALSGRYPLSRPLFMYTAGPPSDLSAELIAFATSDAGQALVARTGFYPLPQQLAREVVP